MVVQELVAILGLEVDASAFAQGNAMLKGLAKGLGIVGAAAAGAAGALFGTVYSMTEAADAAGKMSQRTGVDAAALQEFAYAAKLADVSTESLEQAMRFLAKSGVKDVRGKILELSDQLQKLPEDGSRAAFAVKHFGKMGTALIPMLRGGRKELEEMAAEAQALGVVFDRDTIDASERFNDTLTRIGKAVAGLRNQVGKKLLPVFQQMADKVLGFMKDVSVRLSTFKDMDLLLRTVAFAAAGLATAFAILQSAAIAAAIRTVLAWAASAAPFLLLAAAVTLVLLVLEDIYKFFNGKGKTVTGDFVAYVKSEFGDLQTFLQAFVDWLGTSFVGLLDKLIEKFSGPKKSMEELHKEIEDLNRRGTFSGEVNNILRAILPKQNPMDIPGFVGIQTPQGFVPKSQLDANGNFTSNITINATPGMSTDELAGKVAEAQESWWDSKMRSTFVGAE